VRGGDAVLPVGDGVGERGAEACELQCMPFAFLVNHHLPRPPSGIPPQGPKRRTTGHWAHLRVLVQPHSRERDVAECCHGGECAGIGEVAIVVEAIDVHLQLPRGSAPASQGARLSTGGGGGGQSPPFTAGLEGGQVDDTRALHHPLHPARESRCQHQHGSAHPIIHTSDSSPAIRRASTGRRALVQSGVSSTCTRTGYAGTYRGVR
jgi:hypothetical protein